MTTISLQLNHQEEELFRSYAILTGKSLPKAFKDALAEQIEDYLDYNIGAKALEEIEANPDRMTYSLEEAAKELGISL